MADVRAAQGGAANAAGELAVGAARPALTVEIGLDALIARLAACADIAGVLALGTTRGNRLTTASDLDLVLVLSAWPAPIHVGVTHVAGRLTDLLFLDLVKVRALAANDQSLPLSDPLAVGAAWLLTGEILFDRHGDLARAQARLRSMPDSPLRPRTTGELYGMWFHLNFNLAHNRRLHASDDPLYRLALDYRLLFCLADLLVQYIELHGMRWEGEKTALRYLAAHDPAYLQLYRQALGAVSRTERFALYEQLCALTCASVGPLWPAQTTLFVFEDGQHTDAARVAAALDWWDALVAGAC